MPAIQNINLNVNTIQNNSIAKNKLNGKIDININNKFRYLYVFDKKNCSIENIVYDAVDDVYYQTVKSSGLINGIPLKYIDSEIRKYLDENKITIKNIDNVLLNISNNRATEYDYINFKTPDGYEHSFSYLWNYLNFNINQLTFNNVFFTGQPVDVVFGNKYFEKRLLRLKENFNNYNILINNQQTQRNITLITKYAVDFSFDFNFIYEKYKKTIEINTLYFFNPYTFYIIIPDNNNNIIEIEFKSVYEDLIEDGTNDGFITDYNTVCKINVYLVDQQTQNKTLITNYNENVFNLILFSENTQIYQINTGNNSIEFSINNTNYKIDITQILNYYVNTKNNCYHTTPTNLNTNSQIVGDFIYGTYNISSISYSYTLNTINSIINRTNTNVIDIGGLQTSIPDGLDNYNMFLAFDYKYTNQLIEFEYYAENTRYKAFYDKDMQYISSNNNMPNELKKPKSAFGVYNDMIFIGDLYNANSYSFFNKHINTSNANREIVFLKNMIDSLNANIVLSDVFNINISSITNYSLNFGLYGSIFYPFFNRNRSITYNILNKNNNRSKLIEFSSKYNFILFNLITSNMLPMEDYNKIPAVITSPAYFIADTYYLKKDKQIVKNIYDTNGNRIITTLSDFEINTFEFVDFYILFKINKELMFYTLFYDESKNTIELFDYYNVITTMLFKNDLSILILKPSLKYINNRISLNKYTYNITKAMKLFGNTSIDDPSANFNYQIINIIGNTVNNSETMNYTEIGNYINIDIPESKYYNKLTTNYKITLNQTSVDETKDIKSNYIFFVYKKIGVNEYNDIFTISDDIYISTNKPMNDLMVDFYEYEDNIISTNIGSSPVYSGIDYTQNNPINNITNINLINQTPNCNNDFSFQLNIEKVVKPINYPLYINYTSNLKSKILNKQNNNVDVDIFTYQEINERPFYFYDINIPTLENPPILLKYFPYPFMTDNIKFEKKVEQEFTVKIRFNEKLYNSLLNKITIDLNNNRVVRKKIYVVNRIGLGQLTSSEDKYITKFSGELTSLSTDGSFIVLKVKNILIDYDRYVVNLTSDMCPFEFKSMKCGCTNALAISCNKTFNSCWKNFFYNDDAANRRFGGLKAISYYTKNEYIKRGMM